MSSKVVLRKNGGFYCVYGDDAYILYYLLNYRIIGDKVGFPKSAINKVVNLSYQIIMIYQWMVIYMILKIEINIRKY